MPFVATDEFLLMATGLVSHEISAYLSVFDPFFDLTREDNSAKLSCPDILGLCSNFVESLHGTYFRKLCRVFYETLQIVAYVFGWLYFTH